MHSTKVRHAPNRELEYSGKGILQYRVLGAPVGLPVALASRVIILSSRSATLGRCLANKKFFSQNGLTGFFLQKLKIWSLQLYPLVLKKT
jgi:hypothetical protein